mmetsp:Transcript_59025/g.104888  ORF Transcript_59025/g.104888 Transcript_59025/m.104888 type:complete len:102 (-) Transcript_59025:917-1222(-)
MSSERDRQRLSLSTSVSSPCRRTQRPPMMRYLGRSGRHVGFLNHERLRFYPEVQVTYELSVLTFNLELLCCDFRVTVLQSSSILFLQKAVPPFYSCCLPDI